MNKCRGRGHATCGARGDGPDFVGHEFELRFTRPLRQHMSIEREYSHLFSGPVAVDRGDPDDRDFADPQAARRLPEPAGSEIAHYGKTRHGRGQFSP